MPGTEETEKKVLNIKCERQAGASLFGVVKSALLNLSAGLLNKDGTQQCAAALQTAGYLSVIRRRNVQM